QWNCRSFASKKLELLNLTRRQNVPLLCLSEVKTSNVPKLSQYQCYVAHNKLGTKYQVATFAHVDTTHRQINSNITSPSFEVVITEVSINQISFVVVNTYIWSGVPFEADKFKLLLDSIKSRGEVMQLIQKEIL